MVTVVTGAVPASDLALAHAWESVPDLRFEVERVVIGGDEASMPLLWIRGPSRERVEQALDGDPSVEDVELVEGFEREWLFRVRWADRIDLLVRMLAPPGATVLDAVGRDGQWYLRVLYPDRDLVSKTHEFCEAHGLDFEVSTVRKLDGEPRSRYGLTDTQYEILVGAVRMGHFEVPREMNLKELGEEFGISHQAASERLRRAMNTLLRDVLLVQHAADRTLAPEVVRTAD